MTPTADAVFLLPGWRNAGPTHWLSRWEQLHGHRRVQQHDWQRPLRGDWILQLEDTLLAFAANPQNAGRSVLLAAHGLGCYLVAAWAACSRCTALVRGALLVAPGNPEAPAVRAALHSWSPIVRQRLPFSASLLHSHDDPYATMELAQGLAHDWGADFVACQAHGHFDADSGLGDWPDGLHRLYSFNSEPGS